MALRFLLVLLLTAPGALAIELDPAREKQAQEIFYYYMSPFCPGRLLSDCPSTAASELKDNIRSKLADGESIEQIDAYLVSLYGSNIRAEPALEGVGLLAWWAVPAFIFLGCGLIFYWLRTHKTNPALEQPLNLSEADQKRIEQELNR